MKLSIIIPAYNEAETIATVLRKVRDVVIPNIEKEIIIVDDHSTDGTKEILKKEVHSNEKVITLLENLGKGGAVKAALPSVTGEFVLIQDADLEYDPQEYRGLLEPILKGDAQVVFGSRSLKKNKRNFLYAVGNKIITLLFNLRFKTHLTDIATCYKVFPKTLIPKLLEITENDFVFDVLQLTRVVIRENLTIKEVPIDYTPRRPGRGKKLKAWDGLKILFEILKTQ